MVFLLSSFHSVSIAVAATVNEAVTPQAGDWDYERRLVSCENKYKVSAGYAAGQPTYGTQFPNTTSGFLWKDGGSNVTVSVSLSYGPVSISISPGSISSTGYYINVPNANVYAKLKVFRDVRICKYNVYKKLAGTSGSWYFSHVEYTTTVLGQSFAIVYL